MRRRHSEIAQGRRDAKAWLAAAFVACFARTGSGFPADLRASRVASCTRPNAVLQDAQFGALRPSMDGRECGGPEREGGRIHRGKPLHKLQRRHHLVPAAVASGRLEHQHDLAGGVALHAFVGRRRAGDVTAQLLQRLALVGCASCGGGAGCNRSCWDTLARKPHVAAHIAPKGVSTFWGVRGRTRGDVTVTCRGLQRPERAHRPNRHRCRPCTSSPAHRPRRPGG